MKGQHKRRASKNLIWGVSAAVALVFMVGAGILLKMLISDDGQKRQRQIQMVTLVKPPPPPKIKERPPEPEVKKVELIIEPEVEEEMPEETEQQAESEAPPGDELGLDADGAAGSDSFGLRAKKGGRALIGGGGGKSQYAWYTNMVVREVEKTVNDLVQSNGGCPDSKFKAVVRIVLNERGGVVEHFLLVSSGNRKVDDAISEALDAAKISEPPPVGMPRKMKLKIST
jgi:outer membrane biosynthesis protein TonB